MNKHPNPLQFPYVEIKASSPVLVEEKEPQTPKSFDLCCHVSSSDCTQIEGIRKPLTFPHSARFPLQLHPRQQNRGLDLQLGCQGQGNILPSKLSLLCIIFLFSFLIFGQGKWVHPSWDGKEDIGCQASRHLAMGPFCPCPSCKRKQLEMCATQWSSLFSSVDGSDLFLPCSMKHQLGLARGKGEDGSV